MRRRKKRIIVLSALLAAVLILAVWIAWGNTALMTTVITVRSELIPESFSGFRIVQISDLHNAEFGDGNANLLRAVREAKPDIIVFTGDFVDSYHTDIGISVAFAENAASIAPCYFVTGNHEACISKEDYDRLLDGLSAAGVVVLENESVILERNDGQITLCGVGDPLFRSDMPGGEAAGMNDVLTELMKETDGYTVLLSHRPEMFDTYVSRGADLVLTGHAHGGQFRLPFLGGLAAPGQGLFPEYDAGLYSENGTDMVVSRGVGNSIIPFRVNNRPEIVVIVLNP